MSANVVRRLWYAPLEEVLLRLGDGIENLFTKDEWFLVKALEREQGCEIEN